jgi:hypothetical protein
MSAIQAIQAPMRMKDLVAEQRATYNNARDAFRKVYHAEMVAFAKKQAEEKAAFRQQAKELRQQAKAEKAAIYQQVKAALRQQAKENKVALREQAKAEKAALREQAKTARHKKAMEEKALREQAKADPDFLTNHPNYGGRRHTMTLVLKSLNVPVMPVEQMDKLMIAYAEWLLTVENGRKCRWSLMTAFVTERIVV